MKATMDIPDTLYRRVKAKSALQGQPVREVAVHLFQEWLGDEDDMPDGEPARPADRPEPAWFGTARKYAERVRRHDLATIRRSISRGRTQDGVSRATPRSVL